MYLGLNLNMVNNTCGYYNAWPRKAKVGGAAFFLFPSPPFWSLSIFFLLACSPLS